MGIIESFFLGFGKWFGFVGACIAAPDAACRPFVAFVALAAASFAALTLVVMAYRAVAVRGTAAVAEERRDTEMRIEPQMSRERARAPQLQPRPLRSAVPGSAVPRGLRVAA